MSSISRTPSIYQIRHIASGKVYVGSAVNPRQRWNEHRSRLIGGNHHSRYLQRAWDKYGKEGFVFEIIEPVLFVEDLITREQYWIDALQSAKKTHGYNVSPTAGSALGIRQTEEQRNNPSLRAKRSEQAKVRWQDPKYRETQIAKLKATTGTPEARAKAAERNNRRYADPEERAKQGVASKTRWKDPDYRNKVLEARKSSPPSPEARGKTARASKMYWADPAIRQAKSDALKARLADPAERAKMSTRARAHFENPEARQRTSEALKTKCADPAYREAMSARAKAKWADPEYRARQQESYIKRKKRTS